MDNEEFQEAYEYEAQEIDEIQNIPSVAIIGRPNVGKSSLFNRLVGKRSALVSDESGVTRDRKEGKALIRGHYINFIDTAGLEECAPQSLQGRMSQASQEGVRQADLVLFCIDARTGITPADEYFAQWLRQQSKKILLIANKTEGKMGSLAAYEAYSLGMGEPIAISAEHGDGLSDLMTHIADALSDFKFSKQEEEEKREDILRVSVVGRPNAGKSTLMNALMGEERMLTGEEAGITRDSVSEFIQDPEGLIEFIDTAGMRKKARVTKNLERMSVSATIESIKHSDIVVILIDSARGLEEQDLQIARLVEREGRACIIGFNKWDLVRERKKVRKEMLTQLAYMVPQMKDIETLFFSAETQKGLGDLIPLLRHVYSVWNARIKTGELNRWFSEVLERHQPPLVNGRRIKPRYITQVKSRPPTFIIFGNNVKKLSDSYKRYLVNDLRDTFNLPGIPIRIQMREPHNPFS